jgi:hypothetical protein
MPSLKTLGARFQKFAIEPAPKHLGRKRKDGSIQWGGFPSVVWKTVKTAKEADAVSFLCPLCFKKNKGKVGTHRVRIDFRGRNVPDEHVMHNEEGKPVRWQVTGNTLNDLSTTPSIQIIGGCKWHGYVTNGAAD